MSEKKRWFLLVLIFIAWGLGYVDRQAINIVAVPLRSDLGLSAGEMGMVMSSFFVMYSVMTLSGSFLVNHFGSRRSLLGIVFCWALFSGMTGAASSLVMLLAIRFLLGFSQGGFAPITSVTIAELFPPEERGRAKTFQVSAGSVGVASGTFFCALVTAYFGWRSVFFCLAAMGFFITAMLWKFYHVAPSEGDADRQQIGVKDMIGNTLVWKLAFIQFGLGVFIWGLNAWLPSYWLEVKGLDMVQMGTLSMLPWVVSFLLMNGCSYLLETRFGGHEKLAIFLALLFGDGLMYVMLQADSIAGGFALLTVVTVLMSIASAVVYMVPMKYLPKQAVGTATGMIILGQQLAGIVSPVVMGYLITALGGSYAGVFGFAIAVILLGALTALSLKVRKA